MLEWTVFLPVRMFLKASSTLVESKAEVSINEIAFFSEQKKETKYVLQIQID